MRTPEENVLRLLLVVVSIAFLWILRPFAGALLWGVVFAIVFAPVYRRLERGLWGRGVLAVTSTELIIVVLLIVPLIFVASALTGEVKGLYQVGKDARTPDYVALLSTLGGVSVFGANGFIIGALITALFIATWDIFASDARGRA